MIHQIVSIPVILFLLFIFPETIFAQELITFSEIQGRAKSDQNRCQVREICSCVWQDVFVLQKKVRMKWKEREEKTSMV